LIREVAEVLEAVSRVPITHLAGVLRGGRLLAVSTLEADLSLYSVDPDSGSAERLVEGFVSSVARPPYFSDAVYFTRDVTKGEELHKLFELRLDGSVEEVDMEPVRVSSVVHRDKVFFAGSREENSIYVVENGRARKLLSLQSFFVLTDYSDGLLLGYGPLRGPKSSELLFVREDGSYEVYTPKEGSVNESPIFYKGKVLFSSNFEGRPKLYLLDPDERKLEPLALEDVERFSPYEFTYLGTGSEGELIVIAKRDGRSRVFVEGAELEGPLGNYYTAFRFGGRTFATFTNSGTPATIAELPGGRLVVEPRVPEALRGALREVRYEKVPSSDGLKVPTFILISSRAEVPGPAVFLIHGGPWTEDDDRFDVMSYSLLALGFHVVKPNYRGSTGYGPDYERAIIGDPCGKELEDIASVALKLKGEVASEEYIMGYSYGGYLTLCALTKLPDLFKAGVAGASVADWEEMYELSDSLFKSFIEILFAGRKELFKERSPITYAKNLRAPLCLVHPQNDTRTPLKPVLKLMEVLAEEGKTFEAHVIPDMGHALRSLKDLVDVLLPSLIFLKKVSG